jgi:hypothetical protein
MPSDTGAAEGGVSSSIGGNCSPPSGVEPSSTGAADAPPFIGLATPKLGRALLIPPRFPNALMFKPAPVPIDRCDGE